MGQESSTRGQAQVLSGATQTLRLWGDDRPRQPPLIRSGADCRVALQASQRASHLHRTANIPARNLGLGRNKPQLRIHFHEFRLSCCARCAALVLLRPGESDKHGDV